MPVFTCTDHDNHWVGVASVVVADNETEARALLDAQLIEHGLKPYSVKPYKLDRLPDRCVAVVLQDGDY